MRRSMYGRLRSGPKQPPDSEDDGKGNQEEQCEHDWDQDERHSR